MLQSRPFLLRFLDIENTAEINRANKKSIGCKIGPKMEYFHTSTHSPSQQKLYPSTILPALTIFVSPLQLDLSLVTVGNRDKEPGEGGGEMAGKKVRWREKLYIPKNFHQKSTGAMLSPEGLYSPWAPWRCGGGKVLLLYVSWFRKVGDERNHHPHIYAGTYSDGEGS